ncbi:acyl carrier protein [Acinetobacter modestus]|uniref:Acyl carrier protein n=1 Tax=Acinetobacter modestus TaxID=1776740 RepID=N9LSY2_9GAMM|nr:phosphopantetheine-binding protein [Acinetobacter modestus]ENW99343.1 acyl carrier protein [Acinetobacter modestus]
MNSEKTIEDRLKTVIKKKFGLVEMRPSTRLVEDLHFDSQDTLDLSMAIEAEFGFEVQDEEMETIDTFQSLVDYVTNKG